MGNDREVADVVHEVCIVDEPNTQRRQPLRRKLISRSDVKPRSGVLESKKRHVQMADAPSNKTYGNCLLGLHSSQKHRPETRANAQFPAVAGHQQRILTTAYPQDPVGSLWSKSGCGESPTIRSKEGGSTRQNARILASPAKNPGANPESKRVQTDMSC
jgi:hypothetical protein